MAGRIESEEAMAGDIFVAVDSVLTDVDGENVYITAGQTVRAGHPILKGREAMFVPLKVDYDLPEPKARTPVPPAPAAKKAGAGQ
jgi:hypothetical protein